MESAVPRDAYTGPDIGDMPQGEGRHPSQHGIGEPDEVLEHAGIEEVANRASGHSCREEVGRRDSRRPCEAENPGPSGDHEQNGRAQVREEKEFFVPLGERRLTSGQAEKRSAEQEGRPKDPNQVEPAFAP